MPMPWIKLYTEILDDVKLAGLTDAQKWRFVQLILLAAECDAAGAIVTSDSRMTHADISWRLRVNIEELGKDITAMVKSGLIKDTKGAIDILKFAERQGPTQEIKREQWRKRQQARRNRAIVTVESPVSHAETQGVEEEEDKIKEEEKEIEKNPAPTTSILPFLAKWTGKIVAIPSDQIDKVEQIACLREGYGDEVVGPVIQREFKRWITTPRKDGKGNYKATNFGWVTWAQEALMAPAEKKFEDCVTVDEMIEWHNKHQA